MYENFADPAVLVRRRAGFFRKLGVRVTTDVFSDSLVISRCKCRQRARSIRILVYCINSAWALGYAQIISHIFF